MLSLGYNHYGKCSHHPSSGMISLSPIIPVYQGGDWGHVVRVLDDVKPLVLTCYLKVGLNAVTRYGHQHIKAWHTNCLMYVESPHAHLGIYI